MLPQKVYYEVFGDRTADDRNKIYRAGRICNDDIVPTSYLLLYKLYG